MRNRIAARLAAYFGTALILFAVVVGGLFAWSFGRYSAQLHRQELEDRATRIAGTMAGYLAGEPSVTLEEEGIHGSGGGRGYGAGGMGGYGRYLSLLGDIAMADVWLVDRDTNLMTRGQGNIPLTYRDLPPEAETIIQEVFSGVTAFSESFSPLLEAASLTVGVPITGGDGEILGAVLLHSPIHGLEEARRKQLQVMLISIAAALLITIPVIVLFSLRFTKPLNRMKETSARLAEGDYGAKNNIRQRDEIGALADAMDVLADRLAAANRERAEMEQSLQAFFSNISHELRTPVTVMRGSLEALCDGVVSEPAQVREYHRQMLSESVHLQRLVNDLLELSRLQSVDFQMEMGDVNLCDIVEDVSRSMRRIAESKEVQIKTENLTGHVHLRGDYSRLRQMLLVVVDNAVKFSPDGNAVSIVRSEQDGRCCLSVVDRGPGISEEDLPHIFDRFHRQRSEQNKQGSGLGLAIAGEIAIKHGLRITVSSRPGQTEFRFFLPETDTMEELAEYNCRTAEGRDM